MVVLVPFREAIVVVLVLETSLMVVLVSLETMRVLISSEKSLTVILVPSGETMMVLISSEKSLVVVVLGEGMKAVPSAIVLMVTLLEPSTVGVIKVVLVPFGKSMMVVLVPIGEAIALAPGKVPL